MSIPDSSSTISSSLPRQKLAWRELVIQWAPVLLSMFVFALFARTLSYGLYLDDNHFVRPWALGEVLGTFAGPFDPLGIEPVYFRPFVGITFGIDWILWGNAVWGYHLTNILLHILTTLLIYFFLRRIQLSWWAAWFGAAFFAAIPANAATAVYIAERSDAMVAIFVLCGLLSLDTYRRTGKVRWLVLLNTMFLGAVCSKEVGVAMPMLVALYWLYLQIGDVSPLVATGISGLKQYWLSLGQRVWQAQTTRANLRNWLLILGPLFVLAIAYFAYRHAVLPGAFDYKSSNVAFSLLGIIFWMFKEVPWEVSSWSLPVLICAFGLALLIQPRSPVWWIVGFGLAWVVAGSIPLAYVGAHEPRLFYVVEIGVAIMIAGLVTIAADSMAHIRMLQSSWKRGAVGLLLVTILALIGTTAISTFAAQDQFHPGSQKMLQGDLIIWTDLKHRDLYPKHNLQMVEQHLRDAHMIDANTP